MANPFVHINRQFGIMSSIVFDERVENSKFFYRGYTTERNKWTEWKEISPDSKDVTYGGYTSFFVPLYPDKMGPVVLAWTQGQLTTTGGTYRRFCDYLGLAAIEKIELRYGPNIVNTQYPDRKFYNINKYLSQESKDIEASLLAGNLSTAQRNALAADAAGQRVFLNVPFPFCLHPDRFQEIRALSTPPEIRVYWKNLGDIVQTDGTAPVSTISNLILKAHWVHFESVERDLVVLLTESDHGIVRLTEETKITNTTNATKVPAGTTGEFIMELKNWKTDVRFFAFWVRPKGNLGGDLTKNKWYEAAEFKQINRFRILTGSNEEVIGWQEGAFNLLCYHHMYYHGPSGIAIYFYTWADNPMDDRNATGSYNFQALQNPQLIIDFGSVATAEDYTITVFQSNYQMIQTVRGDLSSQFQ